MSSKKLDSEFTRKILKQVRQIEINTKQTVSDGMAGSYHSIFRGQGMNFEEVREYQAGDDVRNIDWNVTAKMDNAYVKQFREERDLTIILMVDLSASGMFGSKEQSKRELAAEIASLLAFAATRNNDNVGLLLFTDHVEQFIRPKKGRSHILRIVREMLYFEPKGKKTNLIQALDHLNGIVKKKAVVFLLSDFLPILRTLEDPNQNSQNKDELQMLKIAKRRHDLICIRISDPREHELPDVGRITLEDAETEEVVEINTGSKRVRDQFKKDNLIREERVLKALSQTGADLLSLSTHRPYVKDLKAFFARRKARR